MTLQSGVMMYTLQFSTEFISYVTAGRYFLIIYYNKWLNTSQQCLLFVSILVI